MKCAECGTAMKELEKRPYHYVESGLKNVYIYGAQEYKCPKCDNEMVWIPQMFQLHIVLAIAISLRRERLDGPEIRFLRKEVGMTAKSFAEALGVTQVSMSRWENDREKPSGSLDRLIRLTFRFMMQLRLKTMIDYFEKCVEQSNVVSIKNRRLNVQLGQMRFLSMPTTADDERAIA